MDRKVRLGSQLSGNISVFDLRDGDCFNAAKVPGYEVVNFEEVELTPCTGDWVYRALNSFVITLNGKFPGEDYLMAQSDRRCQRLTDIYMFPTSESWVAGDRVVACLMES